jgi:hypothetical protein
MTADEPHTNETGRLETPPGPQEAPRVLTPEAQRALAEAAERRQKAAQEASQAPEVGGRGGLDPVRFGDWETGGIATDF